MTESKLVNAGLAARLQQVEGSPMLALVARTAELKEQGHDIIGLAAGEPDRDTPPHVQEAAIAAMRVGKTRYTDVAGTTELRHAVARKFLRDNTLKYDADQIIVSSGAKQAIYDAFAATVEEAREVIIPTPAYPAYREITHLCGGTPVMVPCPSEQGFKLLPEQLEKAITSKTRWLVLCSPSNPTGAAYSAKELSALGEVLQKHSHVLVLSDDIYEHLLFDKKPFETMASTVPELYDRTLTVNGVSKAYCMTGWRIGFAGGPAWLIRAMKKVQSQITSNPCSISQAAALAALDGPADFLKQNSEIYQERRDIVVGYLNDSDLLGCRVPDGAFYVLASCQGAIGKTSLSGAKIMSDVDFCEYLLDEAGVVVVPGSAFEMPGHFRVSYASNTEVLHAACKKILAATAELV